MKYQETKTEQDFRRSQGELSGTVMGRYRFYPQHLSLMMAMRDGGDPHKSFADFLLFYTARHIALYQEAYNLVQDTMQQIDDALIVLNEEINKTEQFLTLIRQQAHQLPDGTKVYEDRHGDVYAENGQQLDKQDIEQILWNDTAYQYNVFKITLQKQQELKEHKQKIVEFRDNTAQPAWDRLQNEGLSLQEDELEDMLEMVKEKSPDFLNSHFLHKRSTQNTNTLNLQSTRSVFGRNDALSSAPPVKNAFNQAKENTIAPDNMVTAEYRSDLEQDRPKV